MLVSHPPTFFFFKNYNIDLGLPSNIEDFNYSISISYLVCTSLEVLKICYIAHFYGDNDTMGRKMYLNSCCLQVKLLMYILVAKMGKRFYRKK